MKKKYISPTLEVIKIDAQQQMLTGSTIGINSTGGAVDAGDAAGRGMGGYWDDDWEEE